MEVLVEVPVPVKVPVPVPYPAPYPHPYPAPTSPHPTLVHHSSPTPHPTSPPPQYVPTTPRLQVFPHPESALPHVHSTTVRPLFTGSPHPTFQSSTPHPTAHSPIPTIHHQSHSPSPRSFLHSPTPTGQPLTSTATPAHVITATPRIDSDVLDPARAALVEKFNTQLQQKTKDKELSRRKRGVVFPDEANPRKVERHQRKAVPQDRLRPDAPQILGGTVNLAGPRRPNFSLHSVEFLYYHIVLTIAQAPSFPGLVVDRPRIDGVIVDSPRIQGVKFMMSKCQFQT